MTFRLRHLLAAAVLHVLLIALLVGGVQCTRPPTRPPVIQAVLLDPDRKETAQQKKADEQRRRQAEAERKRLAEAERKRQEAETRKRVEQEQQRREAEARQKKVAEQKAAEAQRKADDARKKKELAEQKKAEEAARKKQEEQERREQQEAARREIQEKARMEQAMREEETNRQADRAAAARAASEREARQSEWVDVLQRHIQKYWIRPPSALEDFSCGVDVELLPDGTVVNVRIASSCGNAPLDRSVQDAVYRASPLPRPSDPSVFDRNLRITFVPR